MARTSRHSNMKVTKSKLNQREISLFLNLANLWSFRLIKANVQFNKLTSVFHASVLLFKFRHHIVKVAVDPRGDSRMDPQAGQTYNRTDLLKTDINLFFTMTNGRIARSRSMTRRTNFKFMCLSAY